MRSLMGLLVLAVAPGLAAQAEPSLPLFFFPNTGQVDSLIRYLVETTDLRAAFRPDAAIFQVHQTNIRVRFAQANPAVVIETAGPLPGKANFLLGDRPEDWKTGVPAYRTIVYRELYPGIDLAYEGEGRRIKSEFQVAAGADPRVIRLDYSGADRVFIDTNGNLVATRAGVELREEAPRIYQESDRGRVAVSGRYRTLDAYTVGFEIDEYDRAKPLVIDPVITYATYLGGSGLGAVTGLAVDSGGYLYATGWTEALNFPIAGAVQAASQGGVDAFVVKMNPAGTAFVYATYIGGRSDDRGEGIAVDFSGEAYVTGSTGSSNFPLAAPIRATLGGSRTAFGLKLNSAGNTLLYSTYLGGTNYDLGNAIAVDSSGNAYIAGDTRSANFPVTGTVQPVFGGGTDAFIAKLTPAGALSFSTFLGGGGNEHAGGIAVDASGNMYVAGGTTSTNFPVAGAIQSVNGGGQNAFVTKINSSGSAIVYSTYLGGSGASGAIQQANAIAVDSSGDAYVAGVTSSTNFPLAGAYQKSFSGLQDGFVSEINAAGNTLVYSTYLGGNGNNWASGIAVDAAANAYVAGYTSSTNFPAVNPVQAAFGGLYDAFVSEFGLLGQSLTFSTVYGGTGSDVANAIAIDSNANIFVGGQSSSLDLPLQTPIQSVNNAGSTGWVARMGVTPPPEQVPSANSVTPSSGSGNTVTFTAQFIEPTGAVNLTSVALLVNTSASTSFGCDVTYSPATNLFALATDTASGTTSVIPGGGSAQNSQCTLNGTGSSAVISGASLTLTVVLTFQPGFPGAKSVYIYASDANSNTGWASRGTWTVTIPPPHPSVSSVSPNASTGSGQTFAFVFNDTQTANNFTAVAMLFATSAGVEIQSCFIVYDSTRATIQLLWDNGLGSNSKPITSTAVLSNSQCSVGATSATISGLSLIVTAAITFTASFDGLQDIFMEGSEGLVNTGWVQEGTFNVASGGHPVAVSVVPASGSGPSQRFSFTVSDLGGATTFLWGVGMLFSTSTSATSACSLSWDRTAGTIGLAYDIPANGQSHLVPGSATTISNSQCTLNGANTTIAFGATTVVVTVDLTFNAGFSGAKSVYLFASEPDVNSGWVQEGAWTVTGGTPAAVSVIPSSGAGNSPYFTFVVSDSANGNSISGMTILITSGTPLSTAGACYLVYNRANSTIGLYDDTGTVLSTKGIGYSSNLQNSQCAVGFSSMTPSGNSVQLTVNTAFFTPAFDGAKIVYLEANEANTNSGLVARGVWTVQ